MEKCRGKPCPLTYKTYPGHDWFPLARTRLVWALPIAGKSGIMVVTSWFCGSVRGLGWGMGERDCLFLDKSQVLQYTKPQITPSSAG
jgi:hypothetical protein